jgi:hypothetical protein
VGTTLNVGSSPVVGLGWVRGSETALDKAR